MRPSLIDEQIKRIDFGQFIIDDDTFVTDCLPNYRQLLAKPQLLTKPPLLAKTGFPADAQLLSQHRGQQK